MSWKIHNAGQTPLPPILKVPVTFQTHLGRFCLFFGRKDRITWRYSPPRLENTPIQCGNKVKSSRPGALCISTNTCTQRRHSLRLILCVASKFEHSGIHGMRFIFLEDEGKHHVMSGISFVRKEEGEHIRRLTRSF